MSSTMTEKLHHHWVKHTITKVSLLPDPEDDSQVVVLENDDDTKVAEEGAVYGCDVCGVSMQDNTETFCNPVCHCGIDWDHHQAETHNFVEMR
jgi:hypothetical protein